jgi:hypothetical protein
VEFLTGNEAASLYIVVTGKIESHIFWAVFEPPPKKFYLCVSIYKGFDF